MSPPRPPKLFSAPSGPTIIPVPPGKLVTIETPDGKQRTLSDEGNHLHAPGTRIIKVEDAPHTS